MQSPSEIAKKYYTAMGNKNIQELEQYLHPEVEFKSPIMQTVGKENVVQGAQNFMNAFNAIEIQHIFEDGDCAMIMFDTLCPAPVGTFRAATYMVIEDNFITTMELFFDASAFKKN
jgi:hypothetical protein